jgi:hypothetical protein
MFMWSLGNVVVLQVVPHVVAHLQLDLLDRKSFEQIHGVQECRGPHKDASMRIAVQSCPESAKVATVHLRMAKFMCTGLLHVRHALLKSNMPSGPLRAQCASAIVPPVLDGRTMGAPNEEARLELGGAGDGTKVGKPCVFWMTRCAK